MVKKSIYAIFMNPKNLYLKRLKAKYLKGTSFITCRNYGALHVGK